MTNEEKEVILSAMRVCESMKRGRLDSTDRIVKDLFAACVALRFREEMKYPKIVATMQAFNLVPGEPICTKIVKACRIFPDDRTEDLTPEELETLQKGWFPVP